MRKPSWVLNAICKNAEFCFVSSAVRSCYLSPHRKWELQIWGSSADCQFHSRCVLPKRTVFLKLLAKPRLSVYRSGARCWSVCLWILWRPKGWIWKSRINSISSTETGTWNQLKLMITIEITIEITIGHHSTSKKNLPNSYRSHASHHVSDRCGVRLGAVAGTPCRRSHDLLRQRRSLKERRRDVERRVETSRVSRRDVDRRVSRCHES